MQLADIRESPSALRILLTGLLPAPEIARICAECRALPAGTVRNHLVTEGFMSDMAKVAVLKAQTSYAGIPPAIRDDPVVQRLLGRAAALPTNILDPENRDWWVSLTETFARWFKRNGVALNHDTVGRVRAAVEEKAAPWLAALERDSHERSLEQQLSGDQRAYDIKKKYKDVSSHVDDEYAKEKVRLDREQADKDARKKTKRERKKLRDQPVVDQLAEIISGGIDKMDAKALAQLVHDRGAMEITRLLKFLQQAGEFKKLKSEDFNRFCYALLTEGPFGQMGSWLKKTFWDNPRDRMKQLQSKAQTDYDTGASQSGMHNLAAMFSPQSRQDLSQSSLRKAINGWIAAQAVLAMVDEVRRQASASRLKTAEIDDASGPLFKREPDTGKRMPVPAESPPKSSRPVPKPVPPAPKRTRWDDTEFY